MAASFSAPGYRLSAIARRRQDGKTARRQDGKTARRHVAVGARHSEASVPVIYHPSPISASLGTSTLSGKGSGRPVVGRPLMIMLEACYSEDDTTSDIAVI